MPELNFNLLNPSAELYSGPQVKLDPQAAYDTAQAQQQSNMLSQLYAKHYDPQTGGINYNSLIGEAAQNPLTAKAIPKIMEGAQSQAQSMATIAHNKALAEQEAATAAAKQQELRQAKIKEMAGDSYDRLQSVKTPEDFMAWHLANPELEGTNKAERTAKLQAQLAQPGGFEAALKDSTSSLQRILGIEQPKVETQVVTIMKGGKPTEVLINKNTGEPIKELGEGKVTTGPTQIVNTGETASTAFAKEFGGKAATELDALNAKAQSAKSSLETSKALKPLLDNPNFISGTLGDIRLTIAKALGLSGADETQTFFAGMGRQVAENIKAFGSGTALSDSDRDYAQKIAGGSTELTPTAIKEIMRLNDKYANLAIKNFNSRKKFLSAKNPAINDYYEDISAPDEVTRPSNVPSNWTLEIDASGNKAWVSPDRKQHVEVK